MIDRDFQRESDEKQGSLRGGGGGGGGGGEKEGRGDVKVINEYVNSERKRRKNRLGGPDKQSPAGRGRE